MIKVLLSEVTQKMMILLISGKSSSGCPFLLHILDIPNATSACFLQFYSVSQKFLPILPQGGTINLCHVAMQPFLPWHNLYRDTVYMLIFNWTPFNCYSGESSDVNEDSIIDFGVHWIKKTSRAVYDDSEHQNIESELAKLTDFQKFFNCIYTFLNK